MKKVWNCPFLILLLASVLIVSAFGMWNRFSTTDSTERAETKDWSMYLTSAGEGSVNQSIAVVNAIHAVKEHASGLDRDWYPANGDGSAPVLAKTAASSPNGTEKQETKKNETDKTEDKKAADKKAEDKKTGKQEQAVEEEQTESVSENEPVFELVEDDYFDDALFIGDSRTEGFRLYSGLPNITVYAHKGFQVYTAFDRKLIQIDNEKLTVPEALERNQGKFKKIYMMFGLNEIGWGNDELFARAYYYLIDAAKAANPDAVVYIQSVIHVTKEEADKQSLYTNEVIDQRNELLKKIAEDENVIYLDLNEIFTDEEGNLQEEFSADGIHLKAQYIELWKQYLKAHAIVE